jgi:ribosomal protein S18 acetylase RimI-like enzyme
MEVIRLRPSARKLAARVYARSFFDYPMITQYWPDPKRRARHLDWYLGCALNYGLRYGEVYTTPDIDGIAVWLPPDERHNTLWRYIMSGFIATPLFMGIRQYFTCTSPSEEFTHKIHQEILPVPHWYLWGIAVDPEKQGKGIGKILIQPGLDHADAQKLPCYLETHDEKIFPFYLKRGFEIVRKVQIPDSDLYFWCFVRQPTEK